MSEIEKATEKSIIDRLRDIEKCGLMNIKGYSYIDIASLLSLNVTEVKQNIQEYKKILQKKADEDPYFLEKVQYNTIKAMSEFDELSKEAWETIAIATDHGMVSARIQAIKLAGELAKNKAQLHKLLGSSTSDGEYIARMQKAESVNQILSKILRDVISKYPEIADEVRRELAVAFEIMDDPQTIDAESEELS
jgi:hypothetical protein